MTRPRVLGLALCVLLGAGFAAPSIGQESYPIDALVLEGDLVPDLGALVTTINNLAVNANGEWLVEADTDWSNADQDSVVIANGTVFVREDDPVSAPEGATINSFDSLHIDLSGNVGWNLFLSGMPLGTDSGVYFNSTLVILEGKISGAPEFSLGTPYTGFFDVKLNDSNQMMLVATVDDVSIPTTADRAIVRLSLSESGELLSESVVAAEGDVLPGQVQAVADVGTGPHQSAFNEQGQVLYFADLDGSTSTDGTIYLDDALLAQEGASSPVPGRSYELLSSRGLDLNNFGDVVYKANILGNTADDELLVSNSAVLFREGQSLPAIGSFQLTAFGTGSGPVQIDDNRNVLWFGDWNDSNTDVDTGLFVNGVLVVQEGVTQIDGVTVDTLSSGTDAFVLSDDGQFAIFEATLVDGRNGAFLMELLPPPTVPDGKEVAGIPMRASLNENGTDIDVTWDVTSCTADDYALFYGSLDDVVSYSYLGAVCNLGTDGEITFGPPLEDTFFIVASVQQSNVEGAHGFDSGGEVRAASAGGLCSVVAQINGRNCLP